MSSFATTDWEIGDYKKACEVLGKIPLQLPGPPPYPLSYESAFRKLLYPTPYHRIVYGTVLIDSLENGVRLTSQETVAQKKHSYPGAAGRPARILLPTLEECLSSDDIAFLRKHAKTKAAFKIYFYGLPALVDGSLVYGCQYWQLVEFRPLYPRPQVFV